MKIVKAKEMARIEQLAYSQGASEEGFMNEAGRGIATAALHLLTKQKHIAEGSRAKVTLLCGAGNNAGDAYVAGLFLMKAKVAVEALAVMPLEKSSRLCQLQAKRFSEKGTIHFIQKEEEMDFFGADLLIDGIFGTGFHGAAEGLFAKLIERANQSEIPILAIDIPSGIDGNTGAIEGDVIRASQTLFLGLPKTGCFIGDAWNYVGKHLVFNFGLDPYYINLAEEDFIALTDEMIEKIFPTMKWNRHKYEAGYVVGLGGSQGMPGAPIMASYAALRAGAGLVRLLHPDGMQNELASSPYELIRIPYLPSKTDFILEKLNGANACFIGPGFGTSADAKNILANILPNVSIPCVIDAEALTLIAHFDLPIPEGAILTPHHGEMKRLLNITEKKVDYLEFFDRCQEFAEKKKITLVLKGAPTIIFDPACSRFISTRGNPGMATAGSGDILTGMIAAFCAAKCPRIDAACLGVYLHGMAGEFAAKELTPYCMVATDLLTYLPEVFFHFKQAWFKASSVPSLERASSFTYTR